MSRLLHVAAAGALAAIAAASLIGLAAASPDAGGESAHLHECALPLCVMAIF